MNDIKRIVGESSNITEKDVGSFCKKCDKNKREALQFNEFEEMMKKDITVQ